ncbi:MAG: hypothetical protein ACLGIR_05560 [Actinomycetes bacterium]
MEPPTVRAPARDLLAATLLCLGAGATAAAAAVALAEQPAGARLIASTFVLSALLLPVGVAVGLLLPRTRAASRVAAATVGLQAAASLVGTGLLLVDLAGGGRATVSSLGLLSEVARAGLLLTAGALVASAWQDRGAPTLRPAVGVRRAVLVTGLLAAVALLLPAATTAPGPLGRLALTGPFSPFTAGPGTVAAAVASVVVTVALVVALARLAERSHRLALATVLVATQVLPRLGRATLAPLGEATAIRATVWPAVATVCLGVACTLAVALRPTAGQAVSASR